MSWWGKVVGGALGVLLAGPIGAALGVAVGHQFDRGLRTPRSPSGNQKSDFFHQAQAQAAFFTALFVCMGRLAKSDGQVSTKEILYTQEKMQALGLNEAQRRAAKKLFDAGKNQTANIDQILQHFRKITESQPELRAVFMEAVVQLAQADGAVSANEQVLLGHFASIISPEYQRGSGSKHPSYSSQDALAKAYACLEAEPQWDMEAITKAYKRQIAKFHPDKLVAKGLPDEMIGFANEKTAAIRAAYEQIRDHRGQK